MGVTNNNSTDFSAIELGIVDKITHPYVEQGYDNKGFLLAFFFLSSLLKNSEDISKV